MAEENAGQPKPASSQKLNDWSRVLLAGFVTLISIIVIWVLGSAIIHAQDAQIDDKKWVLSTVLPVFGTWVGTIIAFYFSKENFEAASRSLQSVVTQLTGKELLKSIPVTRVMIGIAQMFYLTDNAPIDGLTLSSVLAELESKKKGDRIPVLTASKSPKYIIHRSMIDQYIAWKVSQPVPVGQTPVDATKLTFKDLFTDKPDLKNLFQNTFAVVAESASLADAQSAMERIQKCEDVYVTKNGTASGEVVGWITDNIVQENLKTR